MRVLLDEHLDHALRKLLGCHEVVTASYMGWAGLKNRELLQAAESAGIEVLVTGDQTLNFEQNVVERRLAIVALSAIQLPIIKSSLPAIMTAIDGAAPGSFQVVECGTFSRRKPAGVIGLKRHTVEVVRHNPGWRVLAADACQGSVAKISWRRECVFK